MNYRQAQGQKLGKLSTTINTPVASQSPGCAQIVVRIFTRVDSELGEK